MDLHDIFDASTAELEQQLTQLTQQALQAGGGCEQHSLGVIEQELEERRASAALITQLQAPAPPDRLQQVRSTPDASVPDCCSMCQSNASRWVEVRWIRHNAGAAGAGGSCACNRQDTSSA